MVEKEEIFERRSFKRDFIFVCSVGFNVGLVLGLLIYL